MRITVRDAIEFIMVPIVGYGVYSLDRLNASVHTLNVQVAVLIQKSTNDSEIMKNLERRIEKLEEKK